MVDFSHAKAAEAEALNLTSLLDQGKYRDGWQRHHATTKSLIAEDGYHDLLTKFRGPLGKVLSREVQTEEFTTAIPSFPDGEYFVIIYNTSFEHKKIAKETLTLALNPSGGFEVLTYTIT